MDPRINGLQAEACSKLALLATLNEELNNPACTGRSEKTSRYSAITAEVKSINRELEAWMNTSKDGGIRPEGGGGFGGITSDRRVAGPNGSFRSLFGPPPKSDWSSFDEFVKNLGSRGDPRIVRSMMEGSVGDGGALVPVEYGAEMLDLALQSEVVRPRARVFPMISNVRKIGGTVIGNHSANLYGGLTGGFIPEGGTIATSEPRYRSMELVARKLACLSKSSLEFQQDAPNSSQTIGNLLAGGIAYFADMAYIHGTGAGGPLGILHSPCLITVDAEESQDGTIIVINLNKMLSRIAPGSLARSTWVVSQTGFAEILKIVENFGLENGVGSNALFQMLPDGTFTLLTRPLLISEACAALGDFGDIILCDFSQYAIGLRSEVRLDASEHVKFDTAEIMYRAILRCDGQPMWNEPLTLRDGVTTVSPFIALEAR